MNPWNQLFNLCISKICFCLEVIMWRICFLIKVKGLSCCADVLVYINWIYLCMVLCYVSDGKPEASIYEVSQQWD